MSIYLPYDPAENQECELGKHEFSGGQCVYCGEMDREEYQYIPREMSIHPPDHKYTQPRQKGEPYYHDEFGHKLYYINGLGWNTKEWVKLFLANWNRAVELWNNGYLFLYEDPSFGTRLDQQEYARICCAWIIPFEMVEPHCVAEGG